jgi:cation-transporting ATPase E
MVATAHPSVDPEIGLSPDQVAERVSAGRVNRTARGTERSLANVIRANVLTPVNGIMLTLFALIQIAGFWRDGLFVGVVVSNSVIGVWQEVKARRELHRLEVLNAPRAHVVRDGEVLEVGIAEVVVDDVIEFGAGDQVVVDGPLLVGQGVEVDESLLTGESLAIPKVVGDELRSGSFVLVGSGRYGAAAVGADSYANSLAEEAKRFSLVNSELRRGINAILKVLVVLIPPSSLLLLFALLDAEDNWQRALQGTVAAAVAMVPDGLVLLTSLAFMAGVISLTRSGALAKELATVELLARVDVLCLDKTGTITTGEISMASVVALGETTEDDVGEVLGALAAADARPNPTMAAIRESYRAPSGWDATDVVPFSSARKWSGATFGDRGSFCLGAPEVLLTDSDDEARGLAAVHSGRGERVLLLSRVEGELDDGLPEDRRALGVVILEDTIRPDAQEILQFFVDQGVILKVISGDNVETVASVAQRAGVPRAEDRIDARTLPEDGDELAEVMQHTSVFGRVTPHQKQAMVGALQSRGHVVAMTGDGVNDVLALKDADMGIAMGNGSAATRGVAQIVLLDNKFATLPEVLAQGRRVINNIERVANLFVVKATYAVLLTAIIGVQQIPFPFLPRQLTLIGTFSIGVPGFFLALAANEQLVRPGFLRRVLSFSLPAGVICGLASWITYTIAYHHAETTLAEARTAATLTLLGTGLVVLVVASRPLRRWKVGLATTMASLYAVVMAVPVGRRFFDLSVPPLATWLVAAAATIVAGFAVVMVPRVMPVLRDGEAATA